MPGFPCPSPTPRAYSNSVRVKYYLPKGKHVQDAGGVIKGSNKFLSVDWVPQSVLDGFYISFAPQNSLGREVWTPFLWIIKLRLKEMNGVGNGKLLKYSCLGNSMDGLQSMELQRVRHD